MTLRIGIDCDPIGKNHSGNEVYLRGLIGGLARNPDPDHELVLFGHAAEVLRSLARPQDRVVVVPTGMWSELALGRRMAQEGVDIALCTYNAPLLFRGTKATIVHDVSFARVGETYPRLLRSRIALSVRRSMRVSDVIVTVSEFSRDEIAELYPSSSKGKVVVTYNAPDSAFGGARSNETLEATRKHYELPSKFILAVGNIQPRKNLPRLVQALEGVDVPLVVVGQPLWRHEEVLSETRSLIRWLGFVPQEDLINLYKLCSVFCYPSLYEGYGLPVVEAMCAGAPVVTSSTTALGEVAAEAAELVDPYDVESIRQGLLNVLESDQNRDRLVHAGLARASDFSWDRSAQTLLDALRLAL